MYRYRPPLLALLVLLFAAAGCAPPINGAAARKIRAALPALLGPARLYTVKVGGDPLRTLHGRLARVDIEADDLQMPNAPLMHRLTLALKGVDFDTRHHLLRHIDSAHFTAELDADALTLALMDGSLDQQGLTDLDVTLDEGNQVVLSGKRRTLGMGVPFSLSGPLDIAGPEKLQFDPQELKIIGIPLPKLITHLITAYFTSSLNLSGLPFPVQLQSLHTSPGLLVLQGEADLSRMKGAAG